MGEAAQSLDLTLQFPACLDFLLQEQARYKVAYGGRGSGKSWSVARALLWIGVGRRVRVLCCRETQTSIGESVHKLLSDQIEALGLGQFYEVQAQTIKGTNGTEFLFVGLRTDPRKVKSTERIDYAWVEEAEGVSEESWEVLIPTVREEGSEIWVTFNPRLRTDATWRRFVDSPPKNAIVRRVSWRDNPWFPTVLEAERLDLQARDPARYAHVWEGECGAVGLFFSAWDASKHVIRPVELPSHWTRFMSFDWGSARPFSVGWWAVSDGELTRFPKGALIRYREWYGASGDNVGLKLSAAAVGAGIREREAPDERIAYRVADPAIFTEDGGPSIAQSMLPLVFRHGDNKRQPGWQQVNNRLIGEDGRPMIYTFDTCRDSIRTIPAQQHDPHKIEDLDTDGEDHAADEWRYACMSRPWMAAKASGEPKPVDPWERARKATGGESWKTV